MNQQQAGLIFLKMQLPIIVYFIGSNVCLYEQWPKAVSHHLDMVDVMQGMELLDFVLITTLQWAAWMDCKGG